MLGHSRAHKYGTARWNLARLSSSGRIRMDNNGIAYPIPPPFVPVNSLLSKYAW